MTKLPHEQASLEGDRLVITPQHDFDREYSDGAHWDIGRPSTNMPHFLSLLEGRQKILDAGCGTGRDVFFLKDQGFDVKGIDGSDVGIKLARERAKELGKGDIQFEAGRIEDLPYDDASFDAIYTGYVIGGETLPKQAAELARVLRPGGMLYVAMFAETKYKAPSVRDEFNPDSFINGSFDPFFDKQYEDEISYSESDDMGDHSHRRIRMALIKKGDPEPA
jgi:SAM-dependent methyltransferase